MITDAIQKVANALFLIANAVESLCRLLAARLRLLGFVAIDLRIDIAALCERDIQKAVVERAHPHTIQTAAAIAVQLVMIMRQAGQQPLRSLEGIWLMPLPRAWRGGASWRALCQSRRRSV